MRQCRSRLLQTLEKRERDTRQDRQQLSKFTIKRNFDAAQIDNFTSSPYPDSDRHTWSYDSEDCWSKAAGIGRATPPVPQVKLPVSASRSRLIGHILYRAPPSWGWRTSWPTTTGSALRRACLSSPRPRHGPPDESRPIIRHCSYSFQEPLRPHFLSRSQHVSKPLCGGWALRGSPMPPQWRTSGGCIPQLPGLLLPRGGH